MSPPSIESRIAQYVALPQPGEPAGIARAAAISSFAAGSFLSVETSAAISQGVVRFLRHCSIAEPRD